MNRRQLETVTEQKHRRQAIASGWFVEKILSCARNGFPDRFYAKDGRVVLIEWKRLGEKLTPQQGLRHAELKKAGVEVHTVNNVLDANRILGIEY